MPQPVSIMGMPLDEWQHESCVAHCAVGDDWATIYDIQSTQEGQGHATALLLAMKEYYEARSLRFGGSIALNERMRRLYQKCWIQEYRE